MGEFNPHISNIVEFEHQVGFIWDIDGVVTDSPHEYAWRITAKRWGIKGFTSEFYMKWVASRPRYEGGHNILDKYGVYHKFNADTEAKKRQLLERFCTEKNALIQQLIAERKFDVFYDAVKLILEAKSRGIKQAAVSASKNAKPMLLNIDTYEILKHLDKQYDFITPGTTLYSLFDVDVCGKQLECGKLGIFKFAANELTRKSPSITQFVVFEDAPMGVKAAKLAGMFAVGIMRIGGKEDFRDTGADILVHSLDDISYDELKHRVIEIIKQRR